MKKLTPNLIVDDIAKCLPFWVDRLGFTKTVEVPQGDGLGFVILVKGPVELMLQSTASLAGDVAAIAKEKYRTVLYFELESLDEVRKALTGWPLIVPERKTPYGATELICEDPAGNRVFFSQH